LITHLVGQQARQLDLTVSAELGLPVISTTSSSLEVPANVRQDEFSATQQLPIISLARLQGVAILPGGDL